MYAVVVSGGKQYRVSQGDVVKLEKIELDQGASFDFDKVLMVGEGDQIVVGDPHVNGAKVSAEVIEHGRDKKVTTIKFKRRKKYLRTKGHRQHFTKVKVTGVAKG